MFKVMSVIVMLGVLVALTPNTSQATPPAGAGWYFLSSCGYYGSAANLCWFGPFAYFGPFTSEQQCTQTVTLYINSGNPVVTSPYAASNCFYWN